MKITEPVTALTDYILAIQSFYLGYKLWYQKHREKSIRYWVLGFYMVALGAFVGGTAHGFKLYLTDFLNAAIWKITVYSIGFSSFFMLTGTATASISNSGRRWVLTLAVLQLCIYSFWMIEHDDFIFVVYDYVPALLGVVALQLVAFVKRKVRSARWLIAGVLVSFIAAGIQVSGFAIHKHFNHNDLYHVVQMVAIYLLYRGVILLRDAAD